MSKKTRNSADMNKAGGAGTEAAGPTGGLSGKLVALILGVVFIVAAAAVVIVIVLKGAPAEQPNVAAIGVGAHFVDDSDLASIEEALREKVAKGMFTTHMNTTWTFPDGKSASTDAVMGNSSSNNYPFWFEVKLDNAVIFESSLLPVGSQVKEIVLNKDLPAGTYPAVVSVHMTDENGEPVESNMGFNITLVVQS
jgi:hypothetical protein